MEPRLLLCMLSTMGNQKDRQGYDSCGIETDGRTFGS